MADDIKLNQSGLGIVSFANLGSEKKRKKKERKKEKQLEDKGLSVACKSLKKLSIALCITA